MYIIGDIDVNNHLLRVQLAFSRSFGCLFVAQGLPTIPDIADSNGDTGYGDLAIIA